MGLQMLKLQMVLLIHLVQKHQRLVQLMLAVALQVLLSAHQSTLLHLLQM